MAILNQQRQSQNADFPNVRPSLDLRFALAKKLDPRITFTRASTGTYVDSDGLIKIADNNQPRFDHDPITGECLGLLIEGSRTNYNTDSNAPVFFNTDVVTSSEKAPDGSAAKLYVPNTVNGGHVQPGYAFIDISGLPVGTTVNATASIFLKDFNQSNLSMLIGFDVYNSTANSFDFCLYLGNPTTAAFSTAASGNSNWTSKSTQIVSYPNGWYRFIVSVTYTKISGDSIIDFVGFQIWNNATQQVYAGDGNSGIYAWGGQWEQSIGASSYIPTSGGSEGIRQPDLVSMTGTNFSSWYNQNEGTILINTKVPNTPSSTSLYFIIFGIGQNDKISIEQSITNELLYLIQNSSGTVQEWSTSALPLNANRKSTFAYSSSNNNTLLSATSNQSYISNIISSADVYKPMDTILIGRYNDSLFFLDGTISRLTYYPIKLTDQQLINLTS